MNTLQKLLLFAGCATFPLYILPSGGVQLAHMFLATATFVALLSYDVRLSGQAILLLALAAIAMAREAFAVLDGASVGSMVQPAYILFNLAVLVAVQTVQAGSASTGCYRWGIIVATGIALVSVLSTGFALTGANVENRAVGTFQNPNQLAYFATIMFSLTVLLYTFEQLSGKMAGALIAAFVVLALAAQSKSGLLGIFFGLAALSAGAVSGRLAAVAAVAAIASLYSNDVLNFDRILFVQRLGEIGTDPDDNFANRGYLVLLQEARHPLEVWFGLGEQAARGVNDREIHSLYVAFFGLYGVAGGILYLAFLGSWAWQVWQNATVSRFAAIVGPPLVFGLAHNGTRFSIFYVLVGLSAALCDRRQATVHPHQGEVAFRRKPVRGYARQGGIPARRRR